MGTMKRERRRWRPLCLLIWNLSPARLASKMEWVERGQLRFIVVGRPVWRNARRWYRVRVVPLLASVVLGKTLIGSRLFVTAAMMEI